MTDFIFRWIEQVGYVGVALLMLLETVFPPIPSEVIMPLAGLVATRRSMALPLVIVAGTAGGWSATCSGTALRIGAASTVCAR